MVFAVLTVGLVGIYLITYWLLPDAKKDLALLPPAIALIAVILGAICIEAFMAWVMLSALSGNPVGSGIGILVIHAVAILAFWKSSR